MEIGKENKENKTQYSTHRLTLVAYRPTCTLYVRVHVHVKAHRVKSAYYKTLFRPHGRTSFCL